MVLQPQRVLLSCVLRTPGVDAKLQDALSRTAHMLSGFCMMRALLWKLRRLDVGKAELPSESFEESAHDATAGLEATDEAAQK